MANVPTQKPPSMGLIIFSAVVTVGLLWSMFFSGGEAPSPVLLVLEWLLLIGNLGFLIAAVVKRAK